MSCDKNERTTILKSMHRLVQAMNDEEAYMAWIICIPDGADDAELEDITLNDEETLRTPATCSTGSSKTMPARADIVSATAAAPIARCMGFSEVKIMRIARCERCGWIGRETEITIPDHCPECAEYGGLKLCDCHQEYSVEELRFLWEQFDDIPITDADVIDEEYMGWPVGTNRFDIWHWFDVRWPKGVYNLVSEGGDLS